MYGTVCGGHAHAIRDLPHAIYPSSSSHTIYTRTRPARHPREIPISSRSSCWDCFVSLRESLPSRRQSPKAPVPIQLRDRPTPCNFGRLSTNTNPVPTSLVLTTAHDSQTRTSKRINDCCAVGPRARVSPLRHPTSAAPPYPVSRKHPTHFIPVISSPN